MSCHDGSVALDQHNQAMASAGSGVLIGSVNWGVNTEPTGRSNLGRDLDTTHPIGFDYNKVAAWRNRKAHNGDSSGTEIVRSEFGFATAVVSDVNTQGRYNNVTRNSADGYKAIADTLYQGTYMTCATCHEVHNKENATQEPYNGGAKQTHFGALAAPNYFLYAKQADSLICLSCHIK